MMKAGGNPYQPTTLFTTSNKNVAAPLFTNAVIRKRISVKDEDLVKYSNDKDARKIALQLILSTHVEKITHKEVLEWGAAIQKDHTASLELIFQLFNAELIKTTKLYFAAIIEALQKIAPTKNEDGLFIKLFGAITLNDSKKRMILSEMEVNIDKLNKAQPDLYGIKQKLQFVLDQLNEFNKKLEPLIISCSFFGDYQKDNFPSDLFLSRLSSLLSTRATIATNLQQVTIFNNNVTNFIDSINNVLLTDIAMWKTSYITSISNGGELPAAENIVNKLKNNIPIEIWKV